MKNILYLTIILIFIKKIKEKQKKIIFYNKT